MQLTMLKYKSVKVVDINLDRPHDSSALLKVRQVTFAKNILTTTTLTTTNKYDFLTYDELFKAIEMDPSDNYFKSSAKLLMSAITDWPTFVDPKDLVEELKKEIKHKLIFDNLKAYLKELKPHKDAWKREAISSLLEMFDLERKKLFDNTIELDTIINQLSRHYKNSCQ